MVLRVRDLTLEEGQKLRRIVRHGQNAIEFKRAQIIFASYQGNTPRESRSSPWPARTTFAE